MNKYKYLLKNMGLLTIGSFSSKILVFLLVPLYTYVLSTKEYGIYDLASTTIQLLVPILTLNIADGVMRYLMDDHYDADEIISIGIKYTFLSIFIFSLILGLNYFFDVFPSFEKYSVYILLLYTTNIFNTLFTQVAKGEERVKEISVSGILSTLISILLNIVLLLYFKMKLNGFFVAYSLGQLSSIIYLSIKVKAVKRFTIKNNRVLEKTMILYSIPLIMNVLGWWANSVSDRYVVTLMCGLAANGVYSVSYKIPSILSTILNIFTQSWQISAIKESNSKDVKKFYGNLFELINLVMVTSCMLLILLSKILGRILYSKDFFIAWKYVPFLLVAGVFNSASGVLGPILVAQMKPKAMGVSGLIGALINIVLNIILVWLVGPQGAAIATAISSYCIYALRRLFVGDAISYNELFISIGWLCIVVQAIVMIYFEKMFYIQLIIIFVYILLNYPLLKKVVYKVLNR